jgi:hypothetical protein
MEVAVDRFVNRQNIDNFADKLMSESDPARHTTIKQLLIEEWDRFEHGPQQLAWINQRLASGQRLIANQKSLIASLSVNGCDTICENTLLTLMIETQALFETRRQTIVDALNP